MVSEYGGDTPEEWLSPGASAPSVEIVMTGGGDG